jgi:hypothetical protein
MTTGTLVIGITVAIMLWVASGVVNLITSLIRLYTTLKGENGSWLKRISSSFGSF